MKLRHHLLLSMMAAGATFAVAKALHASDAVAFGAAGLVFCIYWIVVLGGGADIDPGDFF